MLATVLALLAATAFGAADFVAGLASRRTPVLTVTVISQLSGLATLLCVIWFVPGTIAPNAGDIGWGLAAGCAGGIGLALLYYSLAVGRMSVVSPITAVLGATVPAVFGIATGERPGWLAVSGIIVALIAVVMISSAPDHTDNPSQLRAPAVSIAASIVSGLAIGTFLILLAHVRHEAGLWALAAARCSSIGLLGTVAIVSRAITHPGLKPLARTFSVTGGLWPIIFTGVVDATGTGLYVISTRYGLLSIVAVLTSLYPASTVILARLVLRERMTSLAIAGMVLACVGIALIALGRT